MKKSFIVIAVLGVAFVTFAAFGYVKAQTPAPDVPNYPYGHGWGMMRGGSGWMGSYAQESPVHEAMITSFAEALNLEPVEVEERLEAGESLWEIAEGEGLSEEEIRQTMQSVHASALEGAVESGWLTEQQAEWMAEHMQWMWSDGGSPYGSGGHCGGFGRFNNYPDGSGSSY